jgi:hypothetical protein
MDRWEEGRQLNTSTRFIVEKWSCGEGPQEESWSPQPLTYEE